MPWCWLKIVICVWIVCCVYPARTKRHKGPRWWRIGKTTEPSNYIQNEIRSNSLTDHHLPEAVQRLLKKRQRRLLRENQGALPFVVKGTHMALQGCQTQLHNQQWNCSSLPTKKPSLFGKIVSISCRETAFAYAITSAAVLHAVTRGCTAGTIQSCSCDYNPKGNPEVQMLEEHPNTRIATQLGNPIKAQTWHWGGCSENINFGYKFSKAFVDSGEKGRNLKSLMNLHNSQAGRLHVTSAMRSECKCHGMSGSCAVRTCWRRLPPFKKVGQALKAKFDSASLVVPTREMLSRTNDRRRSRKKKSKKWTQVANVFRPGKAHLKSPANTDLVFIDRSPSFCSKNKRLGIAGTKDRRCNATSVRVDGCERMCCGRGYRSEVVEMKSRCSCTFQWCCEVKCKICHRRQLVHTCR